MVTAATPRSSTVNRQYKSSIFAMLFSDRRELLKLYNAVNGTSYTDPELLTVNTLENAIYMAVKNDVSFLIGTRLYLYEHQSTWNPTCRCGICFMYRICTLRSQRRGICTVRRKFRYRRRIFWCFTTGKRSTRTRW